MRWPFSRRKSRQELEVEVVLGRPSRDEIELIFAFVNLVAPWFIERRTYMALFAIREPDPHARRHHYLRMLSGRFRPADEELRRMREIIRIAKPLCYVAECANQTVEQWMHTPHPDLPNGMPPIEFLQPSTPEEFQRWLDFVYRCIEKNG